MSMESDCEAAALEKSGFMAAFFGSVHERTVPSREAERTRVSVGEDTALTYSH
jgi:hypothetical protein